MSRHPCFRKEARQLICRPTNRLNTIDLPYIMPLDLSSDLLSFLRENPRNSLKIESVRIQSRKIVGFSKGLTLKPAKKKLLFRSNWAR